MRALALFSGGLDSMLAVRLMKNQGIDITAIFIDVGFGSSSDKSDVLAYHAKLVGADFKIINAREQFVQEILFNPKYGYGKNFNPCIDCHANMIRIAKALLDKYDASFIITGEVIGQRPMSQRYEAIKNVTKLAQESEDGIVLRPLSAKLMSETKPEKEGWVDREKLLDIQGRNREVQLRLAKEYAFEDFESPGGGCLLTEPAFAVKIRDFIKYDNFESQDIDVLKAGRHLRLPNGAKLVIGRNKEDNEKIAEIENNKFMHAKALELTGPLSLISKNADEEDKKLAVKLILTYTKAQVDKVYEVKIGDKIIIGSPLASKDEVKQYMLNLN